MQPAICILLSLVLSVVVIQQCVYADPSDSTMKLASDMRMATRRIANSSLVRALSVVFQARILHYRIMAIHESGDTSYDAVVGAILPNLHARAAANFAQKRFNDFSNTDTKIVAALLDEISELIRTVRSHLCANSTDLSQTDADSFKEPENVKLMRWLISASKSVHGLFREHFVNKAANIWLKLRQLAGDNRVDISESADEVRIYVSSCARVSPDLTEDLVEDFTLFYNQLEAAANLTSPVKLSALGLASGCSNQPYAEARLLEQ
ncbi:unnamed protein product [Calicophoron daubneyi]|uniref:Secreted protein n=1 Tax=Calicophoron daubneyi TaxID=300641 RepID=A0AAV2TUZ2_CALDB